MKYLLKLKIPLVIISFGLIFSFIPRLIKIKEIKCESQFGKCSEKLENRMSKAKGLNLHQSKKIIYEEIAKEVLVKEYSVHYQIPSLLVVNVIERKPKFAVKKVDSPQILLLGKDGRVLSSSEATNLPILETSTEIPDVGNTVEGKILFASDILYSVTNMYKIDKARLEGEELKIDLTDGVEIIFPTDGDKEYLLGSFVLVLSELKKDDFGFTMKNLKDLTVDLRYKNPVVRNNI